MKRHPFLALFVAASFAMVACDNKSESSVAGTGSTSTAAGPVELYKLDKQFDALSSFLLNDDVDSFSRGDQAVLIEYLGLTDATAKSLATTYESNQVSGDQKFFKKKLFVTGRLASINSGIGNEPYLVFKATGFLGVQAHLANGLASEAASLKKNQDVALVCVGNGSVAGIPMLADCQFARAVGMEGARRLAKEVEAFAKGKESSSAAVVFSIKVESMARTIDDSVDCSSDCFKRVDMKKAMQPETTSEIIEKMKVGGLQIDDASRSKFTKPIAKPL